MKGGGSLPQRGDLEQSSYRFRGLAELGIACSATILHSPRVSNDVTRMQSGEFPSTAWTLIVQAGGSDDQAQLAMEKLCQLYWLPLYAFARRAGKSREDAEDSTQGFFSRMIDGSYLERARKDKGRLRTFLLTCFKRYLRDEWKKATADKRGGGQELFSIDVEQAEERLADEREETPEKLYERRWALAVLDGVIAELEEEYRGKGKGELFEALQPFLMPGAMEEGYESVARTLGMKENAVGVAVFRLRKRFGEVMKWQVMATVEDEGEVEEELRYLMSALG